MFINKLYCPTFFLKKNMAEITFIGIKINNIQDLIFGEIGMRHFSLEVMECLTEPSISVINFKGDPNDQHIRTGIEWFINKDYALLISAKKYDDLETKPVQNKDNIISININSDNFYATNGFKDVNQIIKMFHKQFPVQQSKYVFFDQTFCNFIKFYTKYRNVLSTKCLTKQLYLNNYNITDALDYGVRIINNSNKQITKNINNTFAWSIFLLSNELNNKMNDIKLQMNPKLLKIVNCSLLITNEVFSDKVEDMMKSCNLPNFTYSKTLMDDFEATSKKKIKGMSFLF